MVKNRWKLVIWLLYHFGRYLLPDQLQPLEDFNKKVSNQCIQNKRAAPKEVKMISHYVHYLQSLLQIFGKISLARKPSPNMGLKK